MYKIAVMGDYDSIYGFASLGLDVYPVTEREEAAKLLRRLSDSEYGVIYITAQNAGLFVSVRVRDTGSGIGEADLPHIFERFYKAQNAGPDSFGVGLALAKAVIERDGGSVKAVSAPGKGSTFTVAYCREKI